MIHSVEIRGQKNYLGSDWLDLKSSLVFQFEKNNSEIHYSIYFLAPNKKVEFHSPNFILFLQPVNEIQKLSSQISAFLQSRDKEFRFEPIETNFELILKKDNLGNFKFYFWIDNGNADNTHYTWDSIGLRLYVCEEDLQDFINNLNNLPLE